MSDIVDDLNDYIRAGFDLHGQMKEARSEIERLRAGGCARNQKTTQWCAEASDANVRALRAEAQVAALREALKDVVEAWDWWQVDTYDRCQSVPSDAINDARAALEEK